jgi:alanine-glyoxylate transaminase/serine-glyoxylate transaminase/serine-pyruvate transaminase
MNGARMPCIRVAKNAYLVHQVYHRLPLVKSHCCVKARTHKCQSWFLDLNLLLGYWGETTRTYHHTAPTNSLYALHESLLVLQQEGLENAWARHRSNHEALKAGLSQLDINYVVNEEARLPQLNAIHIPAGVG